MSSPSNPGGPAQERPKSISKFIRRASKVLRPKSLSTSQQPPSEAAPTSPMIISPTGPAPAPLASHPPTASPPVQQPTGHASAQNFNTARATDPKQVEISREAAKDPRAHTRQQQDKATALFAKYGFSLETRDWTGSSRQTGAKVDWVEKKVRVRVHRECHRCNTSFGSTKVCSNCDHVRCKNCPRWPPRKDTVLLIHPTAGETAIERGMEGAKATGEVVGVVAGKQPEALAPASTVSGIERGAEITESDKENMKPLHEEDIGMPESVTVDPIDQTDKLRAKHLNRIHQRRGVDVVYRTPQHRVRRVCHHCNTLFQGRATNCESCGHQRCPNCPRDPTKYSKFPEGLGYPGDVPEPEPVYPALERVWRKPRVRVRYHCHSCRAVFPSSNEKTCRACKHTRCDMCTREPIKRQPREHNEELMRGLEAKLMGMRFVPAGGSFDAPNVRTIAI